jgi:N-dimethylarginine dimethylaminohydrolase
MRQPHLLMCPPDFYGIEYEINPWMSRARQANHERAQAQWQALRRLAEEAGARLTLIEPRPGLPDLVFTANAALLCRRQAVLAHFRHPQRQAEQPVDAQMLASLGFAVRTLPDELYFEGAGDALFCGETLFAGYRMRSDARGAQLIGQWFGCRVIPLELVDPYYYHLDTCFCPLEPGLAVYFPGAFDGYGRRVLEELVPRLVAVDEAEARHFACNAVVLGQKVLLNCGCPQLGRRLVELGYEPIETPLDEFVKAGGSAKCLTLRLDGEDAARWPVE